MEEEKINELVVRVRRAHLERVTVDRWRMERAARLQMDDVPAVRDVERMLVLHEIEAAVEAVPRRLERAGEEPGLENPPQHAELRLHETAEYGLDCRPARARQQEPGPRVRAAELAQETGQDDIHSLLQGGMQLDRRRVGEGDHALGAPDDRAAVRVKIRPLPSQDAMLEAQALRQHGPEAHVARLRQPEGEGRQRQVVLADRGGDRPAVVAAAEKEPDAPAALIRRSTARSRRIPKTAA